jgi:uncharacterized protein (DUF58 family)
VPVAQPLIDAALARRLERLTLVTRKRLAGQGQGDRRSLKKGSSLEFADYRHYVEGDDPSRVDWNIYGRTNALFVRVYEEEEILNVHLLVDVSRSMDWGEPNKLRYARRVAAGLGYVALNAANRLFVWPLGLPARARARAGDPVGAGGPSFGPAWGRGRAGALLGYLDEVKAAQTEPPEVTPGLAPTPPDLDAALTAVYTTRLAGLSILISDLLSPTWEKALFRLAGRAGDAVVLHTLAPQELRPSLGGDVRLIDRESGARVPLTLNNDALRLYAQRLAEWRAQLESFCSRHGMTYVPVDTADTVETLLFDTLRRRRVVK